MPLIHCKECGKEISALATKCPHCGGPPTNLQQASSALLGLGGAIVLIGIALFCLAILLSFD